MIRLGLVVETLGRWAPSDCPVRPSAGLGVASGVGILGLPGHGHDADDAGLLGRGAGRRRSGDPMAVRQGQGARSDPALDILRQRYARGEINQDEFEAKKRDLAS